ncbi:MAG: GIY-YIG nuclease family protein [Candidatus Pacebacteria bacterium]|nr:GIY-YIG nuclease family protein [Candidatus Paceibacterota bacterium]
MFYVYLLESKQGLNLYTGFTKDLKQRLFEHNQKLNLSTKRYAPWRLIYYEACINKNDAERREKYLKTTQGQRLIKRRLKDYLYLRKPKDLIS